MEECCGDTWEPGVGSGDNLPGLGHEAYVARVGVDMNLVCLGVEGAGVERAVGRGRVGASVVDVKPN